MLKKPRVVVRVDLVIDLLSCVVTVIVSDIVKLVGKPGVGAPVAVNYSTLVYFWHCRSTSRVRMIPKDLGINMIDELSSSGPVGWTGKTLREDVTAL